MGQHLRGYGSEGMIIAQCGDALGGGLAHRAGLYDISTAIVGFCFIPVVRRGNAVAVAGRYPMV